MSGAETYDGGLDALRRIAAPRQRAYGGSADYVPRDIDLKTWETELTEPVEITGGPLHFSKRASELADEFEGQPKLLWLHGCLIAMSRRNSPPEGAMELFQTLWRDHSDFLLQRIEARWKISAAATFRDHGVDEGQRRAGLALALLFNLIKLHDSERAFSKEAPNRAFRPEGRNKTKLALDMDLFMFKAGDLDLNTMLYVWEACDAAGPVMRPLAMDLMTQLNADDRTIFARIAEMKELLIAKQAKLG